MRKILISAALISAAAFVAPASAQYYPQGRGYGYGYGQDFERQLDQIRRRIDRLEDRDRISPREAARLFRHANHIDVLIDRYRRGGINGWEARDLQNRIHHLRQRLQWERQEDRWDDRRDRYDDRRDRYDDD